MLVDVASTRRESRPGCNWVVTASGVDLNLAQQADVPGDWKLASPNGLNFTVPVPAAGTAVGKGALDVRRDSFARNMAADVDAHATARGVRRAVDLPHRRTPGARCGGYG